MSSDKFYSKIEYKINPYKRYGLIKLISSVIAIGFSVYYLITISRYMSSYAFDLNSSNTTTVFLFLILSITFISLFVWGIKSFFKCFKYFGKISIPPNKPPEIQSIDSIKNAFVNGEMNAYKIQNSGVLTSARKYFGDKIPYLTSKAKIVAKENFVFFRKTISVVIIILIVFSLKYFIPDVFYQISINSNDIRIPYIFITLLLIAATVKLISIKYLMPNIVPKTEVSEDIASIKGAGDPNLFISEIEKSLLEIRNNKIPNRTKKEFDGEGNRIITDAGNFSGRMFIENKPEYQEYRRCSALSILYFLGLAAFVYGMFRLIGLSQIFTSSYYSYGSIIENIIILIQGIVFTKVGLKCFKQAFYLIATFRYESIMIFIEFEGVLGRSEIKAGKAITDSFETSNVVIRSDAQFKIYTSKILTENYTLDGERDIISMIRDEESEIARTLTLKTINDFKDEGVAIRGIDISSESLEKISKANIIYHNTKKSSDHKKQLNFEGEKKVSIEDKNSENNKNNFGDNDDEKAK